MNTFSKPTHIEMEARISASLPPRPKESHKGSYGNALLICGSAAYTGAPMLAAMGALRAGAGIVHLASPEEALTPTRIRLPEVVCHPTPLIPSALAVADKLVGRRGAILVGCGIGRGNGSEAAAFCEALADLLGTPGVPVVLDADALNMISGNPDTTISLLADAERAVMLTPHPVEFSRLSGLSPEEVQHDRVAHAAAFAKQSGAIVVLKGFGTVIALPDGRCTVNPSGSSALSKGGSGDVLAGVITGLLSCGMAPAEAAIAAVYLHGVAGERLAEQNSDYGVLPSELPVAIAREIRRITN